MEILADWDQAQLWASDAHSGCGINDRIRLQRQD